MGLGGGSTAGAGGGGGIISNQGMLGGAMNGVASGLGVNLSGIPFIGGMFPNPNEAAMQQALAASGQAYQQMRPQLAAGYQNALGNVLGAYAPVNTAMQQMYGGHPAAVMQQQGNPSAAPPSQPSRSPGATGPSILDMGKGGSSMFGDITNALGLGQNAPFGLPGPGLGGAMSGNVTGNLPGIGGIGSLPGLSSLLGGGSPLGGAVGAMDPAAGFMGSLKGLFGGG